MKIIKNNVVPYYSSYDQDRVPISACIAMIREIRKRGYDVEISEISKKAVERIASWDRWKWYEEAAALGFFYIQKKGVFQIYDEIYKKIKERYKEKRKFMNIVGLYWLKYFYSKSEDGYILKPREEVIEILRSLPCNVYDDITKRVFPETEKQKKLREIIAEYLALGNRYIPLHKLFEMFEAAGYSGSTNSRLHIRKVIRGISSRIGTEILILNKNEELRFLLERELAEYSKKFGTKITKRELMKLSERVGYSRHTFQKASYTQLEALCPMIGEKIILVSPEVRRKEIIHLFETGKITPQEAAEILSTIFLFNENRMKILEYLLEYKRLNRAFPRHPTSMERKIIHSVLVS
ncbi:MAG: hypothetical protein QXY05_00525 [Candidatus Anstonellales archaeon]